MARCSDTRVCPDVAELSLTKSRALKLILDKHVQQNEYNLPKEIIVSKALDIAQSIGLKAYKIPPIAPTT